jgi:zinc and cadmium transporter
METLIFILLSTFVVSLISFIGVVLLTSKIKTSSPIITAMILFAAGTLIGDVLIHLLPEYIEGYGFDQFTAFSIFGGILIMLLIEAYFHCSHDSKREVEKERKGILANLNLIGDALHNFLDGVAIAVSYLISPVVGLTTTIAVILHEIPQELADASVMVNANWNRRRILTSNFLTALIAMVGGLLTFLLSTLAPDLERVLIPIAIGQFIYIALADLLPEIHKKTGIQKYIVEIFMFTLGFLVMLSLTFFE